MTALISRNGEMYNSNTSLGVQKFLDGHFKGKYI